MAKSKFPTPAALRAAFTTCSKGGVWSSGGHAQPSSLARGTISGRDVARPGPSASLGMGSPFR
jgi:hypothetical protein